MMLDAKFRAWKSWKFDIGRGIVPLSSMAGTWKDKTMLLIGKLAFSEIQFYRKRPE